MFAEDLPDPININNFAFIFRSALSIQYAIEISKVEAFYEPAFEKIENEFPNRPVMWVALDSYKNISIGDYRTNEEFFDKMDKRDVNLETLLYKSKVNLDSSEYDEPQPKGKKSK